MTMKVVQASLKELDGVAHLFNKYRVFYQQEDNISLATSFIKERIENNESVIFVAIDETGEFLGFTPDLSDLFFCFSTEVAGT